jgi:hypothetical protein
MFTSAYGSMKRRTMSGVGVNDLVIQDLSTCKVMYDGNCWLNLHQCLKWIELVASLRRAEASHGKKHF